MTGFYILFYIFAVYLSCQAAPAERDIGGSGYSLIMEGLEIQDDEPVFPPFNCTPAEFSESKDRLFIGLLALYRYITRNNILPEAEVCTPSNVSKSIFDRLPHINTNQFSLSLEDSVAVLRAYSTVAEFASWSNQVAEAIQRKMLILHHLLNGVITNYYEVISKDHCLCEHNQSATEGCTMIPDLDLVLDSYEESCNAAAYVSNTILRDQQLIYRAFQWFNLRTGPGFPKLNCEGWADKYLVTTPVSLAAVRSSCTTAN